MFSKYGLSVVPPGMAYVTLLVQADVSKGEKFISKVADL
jgi:hypothetical protein